MQQTGLVSRVVLIGFASNIDDWWVADEAEPDPAAIEAKWQEIAPLIDHMAARIADPDDFPVRPGSRLANDDKASAPYQVSHAVQMCLVAGVDHLHAAKMLLVDFHVLPAASMFSLIRGSLENFGAAFWILHPRQRSIRVERTLRWQAKNCRDQRTALEPLGLSSRAILESRLAKLDVVARRNSISTKAVRDAYGSTDAIKYAEQHSNRSNPLLPWRACSGYAHGRPWAYLGVSAQEQFQTTDPEVLKLKLTTDTTRVLWPTIAAFRLMGDVVELLQNRS